MAGKKVSELNELLKASVQEGDLFAVVNAGESKKLKKSTLFSLIGDMITAAIDAFKETFGILVVVSTSPIANILGTAFTKIAIVDSVYYNHAHDNFLYNFVDNQTEITILGIYEISIFGSFTAPNNVTITFATYVNGAIVGQLEHVGAGAKVIPLNGSLFLELGAGDIVDVRAKADSDASLLTIVSSQYRIDKTHHH